MNLDLEITLEDIIYNLERAYDDLQKELDREIEFMKERYVEECTGWLYEEFGKDGVGRRI